MNKLYLNQILHGDCLELLPKIKDRSIDMILCDLPFQVTQNSWDTLIPFEPLWEQYKRVIKDNGAIVLTAVKPFSAMLIMSNPKMFRYDLVWRKNKSTGFLNANRMPLRQHEEILIFYKKLPTYHPQKTQGHKPVHSYTKHKSDGPNYGKTQTGIAGGGQTDRYPTSILEFDVVNNDDPEKIHSVQKPVQLFEWLIKTYTDENDTVLDTCAGSGTTAIACINTSRNFILMERELNFWESAKERIEKAKSST